MDPLSNSTQPTVTRTVVYRTRRDRIMKIALGALLLITIGVGVYKTFFAKTAEEAARDEKEAIIEQIAKDSPIVADEIRNPIIDQLAKENTPENVSENPDEPTQNVPQDVKESIIQNMMQGQ